MDIINTNLTRAERDNDLIYHYDITAFSQLPPVQEIAMVKSMIPTELKDGYSIGSDAERGGMIFSDLMEWSAKIAIGQCPLSWFCLHLKPVNMLFYRYLQGTSKWLVED